MTFNDSKTLAEELDAGDELRSYRDRFFIPKHKDGSDKIYFTGNSLGLQPKSVRDHIAVELEDWATHGVEGHFDGKNPWLSYHELFPERIAPVVGALPHEVVVMNQLTVNLHLLMVSFYRPTSARFRIICEAKAFPSDQYALESQVRFHGYDPAEAIIEVTPREGEYHLRQEDIEEMIHQYRDSVSLVLFGGVNYYTGQLFDMDAITKAAHAAGAIAGFDLAHAAGNVELKLHEWDVDFACWCSYKYLNSGPGGVAGIFIHEKHARNKNIPRFAGWWGHDKGSRFRMEKGFDAIDSAEGWQLSNAPVISMAVHKASLDIFQEAGMDKLHAKRTRLSAYLHYLLSTLNTDQLQIITPLEPASHGCQVSMLVRPDGKECFRKLTEAGVVADWREPDVIRIAPVPLYNSYMDVWKFVSILRTILKTN